MIGWLLVVKAKKLLNHQLVAVKQEKWQSADASKRFIVATNFI